MSEAPPGAQRWRGGAARCTHPRDQQPTPPVCNLGSWGPRKSSRGSCHPLDPQPDPPLGAGPGVAAASFSDPTSLPRLEGRAGHRKLSWVSNGAKGKRVPESYIRLPNSALREQGEKKKQPLRDLEDSVFLHINRNYCIYSARRSLMKINGCELFFKIKKFPDLTFRQSYMPLDV